MTTPDQTPTVGQWVALDFAYRRRGGKVEDGRGRGVTRRLPAFRRRGWVDGNDYLTPEGRAIATGWSYSADTGELSRA